MPRVTQADVAQAAGCDPAQVSRTLRGQGGVAAATRQRIMAAVKELGYRADPSLSALANQRWDSGGRRTSAIALVFPSPRRYRGPTNPRIRRLVRAMRGICGRLGYELIELRREDFADDAAIERYLRQHAIRGLVVAFHRDPAPLALDWERYAAVVIGAEDHLPGLHRIVPDYRQVMALAVERARAAGYGRLGFCCYRYGNHEIDDAVLSAALLQRWRLVEEGLPRLAVLRYREEDRQAGLDWYAQERPDCVIATHPEIHAWLVDEGLRMPRDVGFIHLLGRGRPDEPDLSCVDRRHEELGRQAVQMLHQLLQHRHYGPARFPMSHLVTGQWYQGSTIRDAGADKRPVVRSAADD